MSLLFLPVPALAGRPAPVPVPSPLPLLSLFVSLLLWPSLFLFLFCSLSCCLSLLCPYIHPQLNLASCIPIGELPSLPCSLPGGISGRPEGGDPPYSWLLQVSRCVVATVPVVVLVALWFALFCVVPALAGRPVPVLVPFCFPFCPSSCPCPSACLYPYPCLFSLALCLFLSLFVFGCVLSLACAGIPQTWGGRLIGCPLIPPTSLCYLHFH